MSRYYEDAKRIMNNGNWPNMVEVMDDDLREQLHREADCDNDFEFCEAYLAATTDKDRYNMIKSFAVERSDWYQVLDKEVSSIIVGDAYMHWQDRDLVIFSDAEDPEFANRYEVRFADGMVCASDLMPDDLQRFFADIEAEGY